MDIYNFSPADLFSFLLTLMRISLVIFLLPLFGADNLPATVKGAVCIVIAAALWPHLSFPGAEMPGAPLKIVLMILSELVLGLTLGMVVRFSFYGIQSGGEILAAQMGFSMASIADPSSGAQQTVISNLLYLIAMLCFLVLDGHLLLFKSLADTFIFVPPGGLAIKPLLAQEILNLSSNILILAVKIAAPLIGILFLIELALALMAKAAPQMNLLIIGFPLKIGIGLFFMGLIFILISQHMHIFITNLIPLLSNLLQAASPLQTH